MRLLSYLPSFLAIASVAASANGMKNGPHLGEITSIEAPPLAMTSHSVTLLWDDSYIPDYSSQNSGEPSRIYYVYQDGMMIGRTEKRSFPVYGLEPSTSYTLSIRVNNAPLREEDRIQVRTKKAGKIHDVRSYGAKGDGKTLDTPALQAAIDDCSIGGTVLVTPGTYLLDHVELKSDMTLDLQKGAVLTFLGYNEGGNYPLSVATLPATEGETLHERKTLIRGYKIKNVVITGAGTINGNGETWWPNYMIDGQRLHRPFTLELIGGSHVLVQGVTFQDPPAWNNHLVQMDQVFYSDVKFLQVSTVQGHNGDALNPNSSRNVLIVGCLFGNQDDSIAIKASSHQKKMTPTISTSENIVIRDCVFDGNAAPGSRPLGIAIGSEVVGGARNIVVQNCVFRNTASIINIKANHDRPYAWVDNIQVKNIKYSNNKHPERQFNHAPLSIDLYYYSQPDDPNNPTKLNETTPRFRNIHFKNIKIENKRGKVAFLRGMPESPLKKIVFEKILGEGLEGFYGENIDGIDLMDVEIRAERGKAFVWENVSDLSQDTEIQTP